MSVCTYTFRVMLTTRHQLQCQRTVGRWLCVSGRWSWIVLKRWNMYKHLASSFFSTHPVALIAHDQFSTVTENFLAKNPTIRKLCPIVSSFRCLLFFFDSGIFKAATADAKFFSKGTQRFFKLYRISDFIELNRLPRLIFYSTCVFVSLFFFCRCKSNFHAYSQ